MVFKLKIYDLITLLNSLVVLHALSSPQTLSSPIPTDNQDWMRDKHPHLTATGSAMITLNREEDK